MHALNHPGAGSTAQWFRATMLVACLALLAGPAQAQESRGFLDAEGGVKYRDLAVGSGIEARPGMVATIHFRMWLDDSGARGAELANTRSEARQISFVIGTDKVMPAWNAAVPGMRPGGKRLLLVPSDMAYGSKGVAGLVPKNAPLVMEIELIEVSGVD